MRILTAFFLFCTAFSASAEPVCVKGVCYPDEASALAAGVSPADIAAHRSEPSAGAEAVSPVAAPETGSDARRLKIGAMGRAEFLAFLRNESVPRDDLESHSVAVVFLLVLLGGLAANLTPCVLPLVPVNLALVGKGASRGAAYGLGITAAYGLLGLAAAFGGMAFGAIQSSPWFNLLTAGVFTVLALAMGEVFFIDFSRFRPGVRGRSLARTGGLVGPFLLGAGAAVLAGACVEPILLATLVLTAKWFAAGKAWAVVLPFVLGAGMGLPWPFAAAGLSVLPRPGAWMRWVNRAFAVVLVGMACWYGWLAWKGFADAGSVAAGAAAPPDGETAGPMTEAGKPRLIIVGAPWCKNCTVMNRTVLKEPDVLKEMSRFEVVHVEIDTPEDLKRHPDLTGLDILGVPAYVVKGERAKPNGR